MKKNLINWILNVMHEKTNRFWTDYGLSNNLPSGLLLHMEDILRSWLIFCVVLLSESRSIHFLDSPSIAVSRILVQMPLRYSNLFVAWWDTWVEKNYLSIVNEELLMISDKLVELNDDVLISGNKIHFHTLLMPSDIIQ